MDFLKNEVSEINSNKYLHVLAVQAHQIPIQLHVAARIIATVLNQIWHSLDTVSGSIVVHHLAISMFLLGLASFHVHVCVCAYRHFSSVGIRDGSQNQNSDSFSSGRHCNRIWWIYGQLCPMF